MDFNIPNFQSKQRISSLLADPLLSAPKPRTLENIYRYLLSQDSLMSSSILQKHLSLTRNRCEGAVEFSIEILDVLLFIAKARKDTVSELIAEAAISILEGEELEVEEKTGKNVENKVPIPVGISFFASQIPIQIQASREAIPKLHTLSPTIKPDPKQPQPTSLLQTHSVQGPQNSQNQQSPKQLSPKQPSPAQSSPSYSRQPQPVPPQQQPTLPSPKPSPPKQPSAASVQMDELMKHKAPLFEQPKLVYDDTDEEDIKNKGGKESNAVGEEEENYDEGEEEEGDEEGAEEEGNSEQAEEDEEVDEEQLYEKLKDMEDPTKEFNNNFFHDVKSVQKSGTKKNYVFSKENDSRAMEFYTEGPAGQKMKGAKRMIKVPKQNFTKHDKKHLGKALHKLQGVSVHNIAPATKAVDNIAFQYMTKSEQAKLAKEAKTGHGKKTKQQNNGKQDKQPSKKEMRKQRRKEAREKLQVDQPPKKAVPEQPKAEAKEKEITKTEDKPSGLVARSMAANKFKKAPEPAVVPAQSSIDDAIFGTKNGKITEYSGILAEDGKGKSANAESKDEMVENAQKSSDSKYLSIADICPTFTFEYIAEMGDNYTAAMQYLSSQTIIGIDTEFISKDNLLMATYVQLATLEKGFVINLQKSQHESAFKDPLMALCANPAIKKIGFSIKNDIDALNRVFNNNGQFSGFVGLEELLFTTIRGNSSLGLAQICRRYYGKPLNKEMQETIAAMPDLEPGESLNYAAMDALVPLCLHRDLKTVLECRPMDHIIFKDHFEPNDVEFVLDPSCKALKTLLQRSEFGVHTSEVENMTYKEIAEFAEKKKAIIVTCDKYIICNEMFRNKMVYFDTTSFKEEFYELTNQELS